MNGRISDQPDTKWGWTDVVGVLKEKRYLRKNDMEFAKKQLVILGIVRNSLQKCSSGQP